MNAPSLDRICVLIVEDGDEYLENLSRFVPGPRYLQVKSGRAALDALALEKIDILYLDMRFDRIPQAELEGDHAQATRDCNGDPLRAWRHLQNHQGLYILNTLHQAGYGQRPVVLAYDFSHELRRYNHLRQTYPNLSWVPDGVGPSEIQTLLVSMASVANLDR